MAAESDLLVVGAGAKAAGIAVKVHALNTLGLGPISMTVVEGTEVAASWKGLNGVTSGEEPLAVTPIKDVGFPYQSFREFGEAGEAIDEQAMGFSWQRYMVARRRYARWIDAGSPSVRHRDYGEYLTWVLGRATEGVDHVDKIIEIDQSPIGRTPRSNPATYLKAFDAIRDVFSRTPEARRRGYSAGSFSFNIPGGRCEACQGGGTVTVEMQFLADVELVCEECKGTRYKPSVLEVTYRGKNVHEVLQMTAREALAFFAGSPKVVQRLKILDEVGLGYLRLGQSATTLSGGEAQRLKLGAHLTRPDNDGVLYVLDEPTTGLHFDDIQKLLTAFRRLIDAGASVVVIEHNLDVIKSADWVIDLGPEGGERGGRIVVAGPPETVAGEAGSHTGHFLAQVLARANAGGER